MKTCFAYLLLVQAVTAPCTMGDAIALIRPGAEWVLTGETYQGLNWLDKRQLKPTSTEVDLSRQNCLAQKELINLEKQQAKIIATDQLRTDAERINALTKILDLE